MTTKRKKTTARRKRPTKLQSPNGWGAVTVLEGPDGGGKTTLAKSYARLHPGTRVVHLGPHKGDPFVELVAFLRDNPGPVVFDRFHLGEQAYGPVYRGKDGLGDRRADLEVILKERRAVVVLALPPYAVCRANWEARKKAGGEMFPDPAKHKVLYDRYMTKVRTDLPVVMYDYKSHRNAWLNASVSIDAARTLTYGQETK